MKVWKKNNKDEFIVHLESQVIEMYVHYKLDEMGDLIYRKVLGVPDGFKSVTPDYFKKWVMRESKVGKLI